MKVTFDLKTCMVETEEKYPTETAFWYALKLKLVEMGHDVVKKVMSKDGHMVGGNTYPYYLRERNWQWCIWDGDYAIRFLHQCEKVNLSVERLNET